VRGACVRARGLLFPPELMRTPGRRIGTFMHPNRLKNALATATAACELREVMTWSKPWYQATRHTCATHWMRAGHGLGELSLVLGHSAIWVTERYAHIRPGGAEREDPWTMVLLAPADRVNDLGSCTGHAAREPKRKR
jgi:integrase